MVGLKKRGGEANLVARRASLQCDFCATNEETRSVIRAVDNLCEKTRESRERQSDP